MDTEYNEEELQLLARAMFLPGSPCGDCRERGGCAGGCASQLSYERAWKPYREADLVDTAVDIRRLFSIEDRISGLKLEAANLRDKHKGLIEKLEGKGLPL